MRTALISLFLALVVAGCGDDETTTVSMPEGTTTPRAETKPSLNVEVQVEEAPPGSDQRVIAQFARTWAKDFATGHRLTCVLMAGPERERCRTTYATGAPSAFQQSFAGAKAVRISAVTSEDQAGVEYSNGEFVEFTEYAELWKVTGLGRAGGRFFSP